MRLRAWAGLAMFMGACRICSGTWTCPYGFVGGRTSLITTNRRRLAQMAVREVRQRASTSTIGRAEDLFPTCFDLELPIGRCLGVLLPTPAGLGAGLVDLDDDLRSLEPWELHPEEVKSACAISNVATRLTFLGGRIALRRVLSSLPKPISLRDPVLKDDHGAPVLPRGIQASISHKKGVAVCLVRTVGSEDTRMGVDIEMCQPRSINIAPRILTPAERNDLGSLEGMHIGEASEVLLRFSAKESIYKAIHPFVQRYVSFQEAEVRPEADGSLSIELHLKDDTQKGDDARHQGSLPLHWRASHKPPLLAKGWWTRVDVGAGFFLTAVSVTSLYSRSELSAPAGA